MKRSVQTFIKAMLLQLIVVSSAFAQTYYIDYLGGADTNSGTSKTAPWKYHPYMAGWSGGAKYAHAAGDQFIFKGGVTWTSDAFLMSIAAGGSPAAPDYYGVDETWFAGSQFARPVFDVQGKAKNGIVSIDSASYITIDNIEMKDVVFTDNEGSGLITIGIKPKNIQVKNCFLHKWTLASGIATDDAHGGVIVSTANLPPEGIVIDSTTISNSEYSSTKNNGVAIRSVQTVSNSTINDVPTAILYAGDVHNNHIFNIDYPNNDFDPAYHTNLIYMAAQSFNPPVEHIYNNKIHDIGTGAGVYAEPCFYAQFGYATIHIYNNLIYNARNSGGGIILVDSENGNGACGSVYIYQNTLQMPDNAQIGMIRTISNHSGTNKIGTLVIKNNHYIGPNGEWDTNLASSSSSTNNIQMTNTVANTNGYNTAGSFKPSSSTSPTVNKGLNFTCAACAYIDKDFQGVLRGEGGAWDVGAYEFTSSSSLSLLSPKNLRFQ
jgi:hypothetical protein